MSKTATKAAQPSLWSSKVPESHRLYADIEAYLLAQPTSRERDDLLLRVANTLDFVREAAPRQCQIRTKYKEWHMAQRYPFFNAFITDGSICAGCGGYNDYGMRGYAGILCWECYKVDEADLNAHPEKRGGCHAPPPPQLPADPVFQRSKS